MLRFCRSTLSIEAEDKRGGADILDVHFGDTAGVSSISAVPLARCFDHAQHLNEQVQVQLRALLAQLQPCHTLSTIAAPDASRAVSCSASVRNNTPATAAAPDLAAQLPEPHHISESEADLTQDSQAVGAAGLAVESEPGLQAQHLHTTPVASCPQDAVEAAVPPSAEDNAALPAIAAPGATVWPSMIPETCWDFATTAGDLPANPTAADAQHVVGDAAAQPAQNSSGYLRSDAPRCLHQAPANQQQQQQQQGQDEPEGKDMCHVAPIAADDSRTAKQVYSGDIQQVQRQQQQGQAHCRSNDRPTASSSKLASGVTAEAGSATIVQQAEQHTKQTLLALETPISGSKHIAPQLQLQPVRSAAASPALEQQTDGKQQQQQQQRQPLVPISAGNAPDTPHAAAVTGSKSKHKLTVLDQLAALPVRRSKAGQPAAAAAAAAAGAGGSTECQQQTGLQQQQTPLGHPWQGHQQQWQQCARQQPQQWQHFQPQQQWQQPWPGHQQQQQNHHQQQQQQQQYMQGSFGKYKPPAGLRPSVQQQQQHLQQEQQQQPAAASGPSAAAKAYRQKTNFKCPRPINPAKAMGRGTAAAAAGAGVAQQVAEQDDPVYTHMLAVAAAAAPDDGILFVTCGGKKLEMSETAKARTAALLAEAEAEATAASAAEEQPILAQAEGAAAAAAAAGDTGINQHRVDCTVSDTNHMPAAPNAAQCVTAAVAAADVEQQQQQGYSQLYDALDPAVQAACARFQAQLGAGGPTESLGFVNLRGSVQVSAAAAATSARYMQFMQEAAAAEEGEEAQAANHSSSDRKELGSHAFTTRPPEGQLGLQETNAAAAAASSSSVRLQPPNRLGGGRGAGAFKPPRPVAPRTIAPEQAGQQQQQQQQPLEEGLLQKHHQQDHLDMQENHHSMWRDHLVTNAAAAAAASSSGTQGGNIMANSQELASLDRLMEVADTYAAQHAAAKAAAAAAVIPQALSSAAQHLGDIHTAAAAAALQPGEDVQEPSGSRLGIRAAAAAVAAAASLGDDSTEATEVPSSSGVPSVAAASTDGKQGTAGASPPNAVPHPAALAYPESTREVLESAVLPANCTAPEGSIMSSSVGTGSTSCAGGSTLERQISDASGGVVSDTLVPDDEGEQEQQQQQHQQRQQQHFECQDAKEQQQHHHQQLQQQEQQYSAFQEAEEQLQQQDQQQQQQQQLHKDDQEQIRQQEEKQEQFNSDSITAAQKQQQQQQYLVQVEPAAAEAAAARPQRQPRRHRLLPVQVTAAAAAAGPAVLSPYSGLIWASGDGLLLSQPAAARGQAFVERLQHMALLPTDAAAGNGSSKGRVVDSAAAEFQQCLAAVDILVTAAGAVELTLVDSSAPAAALLPAAVTGAALAAAGCLVDCGANRSGSKRTFADMTAATGTTDAVCAETEIAAAAAARVAGAEAQAAAAAEIAASAQPAAKRLSGLTVGSTTGMQASSGTAAAAAGYTDLANNAVIAETPAEAPPAMAAAAAAAPLLHSPSPSPAKGRKLSFSAAAFATPLPAPKVPAARGAAAAAIAAPPIPETPASAVAAAAADDYDNGIASVVAETPASTSGCSAAAAAAADAGRVCVVPATPLTGDIIYPQQQQQPDMADVPFEQQTRQEVVVASQQAPAANQNKENFPTGQEHLMTGGVLETQQPCSQQRQQQQPCGGLGDFQLVGDTLLIQDGDDDDDAGDEGRVEPLADTLEVQQEEQQPLLWQQQEVGDTLQIQQDEQQQEEVGDILQTQQQQQHELNDTLEIQQDEGQQQVDDASLQYVLLDDTLVLQPDEQQQQQEKQGGKEGQEEEQECGEQADSHCCTRDHLVCGAGDTLVLCHSQQQQQQQHDVGGVPDTLILDPLAEDHMMLGEQQQQHVDCMSSGFRQPAAAAAAADMFCETVMMEVGVADQQQEKEEGCVLAAEGNADAATSAAEAAEGFKRSHAVMSAAVGGIAGLQTAGGRRVPVDAEQLDAFHKQIGWSKPQQQQQQQDGRQSAEGADGHSDSHPSKRRSASPQEAAGSKLQQQQQQEPAAAARSAVAGLSTGSGEKVTVDPAAAAAFQQRMGALADQQQQAMKGLVQQQQQQQQPAEPVVIGPSIAAAPAAGVAGLSTGNGRTVTVDPSALAAFKKKVGAMTDLQHSEVMAAAKPELAAAADGAQQMQQQQQQPMQVRPKCAAAPAAAAGGGGFSGLLSTASGKRVDVDPAAAAAFKQKLGMLEQQSETGQQFHRGMPAPAATAEPAAAAAVDLCRASVTNRGDQQQQQQAAHQAQLRSVVRASAAATAAGGAVSKAAATSQYGASKPPAALTAAAAAAAVNPMSAPRTMTRKRQLPAQQQQQQQRTGGKKAFKLPVRPGSTPVDSAAAAAAARTGLGATKGEQQQQQQCSDSRAGAVQAVVRQPKSRGLPLAEYFAMARAKRAAAVTADAAMAVIAPCDAIAAASTTTTTTLAAAASASGAVAAGQWLASNLPVTPDEAAAFKFVAAAPQAAAAAAQQQHKAPEPAAGLFTSAAAVSSSSTAAAAAAFGWSEARQQLIAWGADRGKATSTWVSNHYKWIVWKLAAYDRKLLAGSNGSSLPAAAAAAGGGGGSVLQHPGVCCLTVDNVLLQLQKRYTAEMVEGQRSVLKKILEQDLPAYVPLVLMVSAIRTSGGSNNKAEQQQQQQEGDSRSTAAAAAVTADVLGIQLSDGWYHINAIVDAPLTDMINQGKIQVGSKLRVVGCELRSDRPADPLEAAKWALLKIWYNGTSPAAWDEKLGPVTAGHTLRALSRVHPAGGLVPRLLLLVQRCYPLLYYCRSSRRYFTRKQHDAAQRRAEKHREQAMQTAAAAVQQAELEQCKLWATSRTASAVEKAYAAAMLGSCEDGVSDTVISGQLQGLKSQRESYMDQQRQQHIQQLLAQANSLNPAASGGGGSSVDVSSNWSLEPPVPVQRFRVSGVVPQGLGPVWGFGQAMIRVWRASDVLQGLDEGLVVLATGLQAGSDGRSSLCDIEWQGAGRMLELSSGKHTSWQVLGAASALAAQHDIEPWHSRQKVRVGDLTEAMLKAEFDCLGALLFAGEVVKGHRDCHQWVFLAGDASRPTAAAAAAADATSAMQDQAAREKHQHQRNDSNAGAGGPSVIAIKLVGSETAVDWLEPTTENGDTSRSSTHNGAMGQQQLNSSSTKTPAVGSRGAGVGNNNSNASTSRATSRRFITAKPQPQQQSKETLVSCSSLILSYRDQANSMWVATAHDTAVLTVLAGAATGSRAEKPVQEMLAWAKQEQQLLVLLKQQVKSLVQG